MNIKNFSSGVVGTSVRPRVLLGITCLFYILVMAFGGVSVTFAQGRAVGPTMCACPGAHKPLGNSATCEEACYGNRSGGSPGGGTGRESREEQRLQAEAEQAREQRFEKIRVDVERVMSDAKKYSSPQARLEAYYHARDLYREQQAIRDSATLRDLLAQVEAQITWYSGVVEARKKNYMTARDKLSAAYKARPDLFNDEHLKYIAEVNRLLINTLPNSARAIEVPSQEAVALEKRRLTKRDAELTAAIDRDLRAIQGFGFDRRAEDFAEWERLGASAKASFEKEIIDSATDMALAKVRGRILEGFKAFDAAQAARWIGRLSKVNPRPVELIGMIERLSKLQDKAQIAASAELILDRIEKLQKTGEFMNSASTAQAREVMLLMGLDLVCDVVPPPGDESCKAFKTIGSLTAASLYNNAARRVAIKEVERLTTMTEAQLRGLAKVNELMAKHVKERNEVREKLKALL